MAQRLVAQALGRFRFVVTIVTGILKPQFGFSRKALAKSPAATCWAPGFSLLKLSELATD